MFSVQHEGQADHYELSALVLVIFLKRCVLCCLYLEYVRSGSIVPRDGGTLCAVTWYLAQVAAGWHPSGTLLAEHEGKEF